MYGEYSSRKSFSPALSPAPVKNIAKNKSKSRVMLKALIALNLLGLHYLRYEKVNIEKSV